MSPEEAARGYPIRLRGIITYYDWSSDPEHEFVFLHDQSGTVFGWLSKKPHPAIYPGQMALLTGISHPGGYAAIVADTVVQPIGQTSLPVPEPTNLLRMLTGAEDAKWLTIRGIVIAAQKIDPFRLQIPNQFNRRWRSIGAM